jgi:spoIIIJ-associated protein
MENKDEIIAKIKEFVTKYFELLGIAVDYDLELSDESVINLKLRVEKDSAGLIIGNKGSNLFAFQTILRSVFRSKFNDDVKFFVDIDDWRGKEEQRLQDLASKTAERVVETGEPQNLYNLTPSQRRIIHICLSKELGIKTESFGEGTDRYLVVSPK